MCDVCVCVMCVCEREREREVLLESSTMRMLFEAFLIALISSFVPKRTVFETESVLL
jgi:hypothetical protein